MRIRFTVLGILLLGILAGFFAGSNFFYGIRPYRLGLDLLGGTHLLYRADVSALAPPEREEATAGLRDVIERRVNLFGVAEPLVQVERHGEEWRLIVEIAGVKDISEAINIVGRTALLEFKELRPELTAEELGILNQAILRSDREVVDQYFVATGLTGRALRNARVDFLETAGQPYVIVDFNADGERQFEAITLRNVGKPLGIFLDEELLTAPIVQEKISGSAQITGRFTQREARNLLLQLKAGALPVPVTLIAEKRVGASLGEDTLELSLQAALYGFAAVSIFMLLWYRLPGAIAVLALFIYAAIVLSIFKLIPVTLTAAGIAGFILSIGMAVDANILIFERMREELLRGRDLAEAIGEGFSRAWTSIRDSNVSTIISAAILFWFGTSVVQGFALTLGIGVIISMLTAISVSRTFLLAVVTPRLERARWLFLSGFTGNQK